MLFQLQPLRFTFLAEQPVRFGRSAANVFRGALGVSMGCRLSPEMYHRIFEPHRATGPSGLRDPPRPFVLRARWLDGRTILPGQTFHVDLNLFDTAGEVSQALILAFEGAAQEGLGPDRGRAILTASQQLDRVLIDLATRVEGVNAIRVRLLSPTELKGSSNWPGNPEFSLLAARIRDRLSALSGLYGEGPLTIDFEAFARRSATVETGSVQLIRREASRRSSRSGQSYSLGGVTGEVEYRGDLPMFMPFLEAARWTGVGRHTVWGKGELAAEPLPGDS